MTATATNVAQDGAWVGIQAESVIFHNEQSDTESPEELFRRGVSYLESNIPGEARKLFEEAAARGYQTNEVRFYRLLALLSRRTLRQLSDEEFDHLTAICRGIDRLDGDDEWTAGLRAILRLVSSSQSADPDRIIKELDSLNPRQRDLILQHLGTLLEGPIEDHMWQRRVEQAKTERMAGDRAERIKLFFTPEPEPPEIGLRPRAAIPLGTWLGAVVGAAVFVAATGTIGSLLVEHGAALPMLTYLVALGGLTAVVVAGAERHYRQHRLRAKEAELNPAHIPASDSRFARQVERHLERYFGRYLPRDMDRELWLAHTAGIRARLRDELVATYQDRHISVERIAWLIRHEASEAKQRWDQGVFTAHRIDLRAPVRHTVSYTAGIAVLVSAAIMLTPPVMRTAPFVGALALLLAVGSGVPTTRTAFRIATELRRVRADYAEQIQRAERRRMAFKRWQEKRARKPSDAQLAAWLECDRTLLVDEALQHYGLKPSQVIAHAFIEAPGPWARRQRDPGRPWRYTTYRLLLFLLTDDGVRQLDIILDFEAGRARVAQRLNYRFDAVAAVSVDGTAPEPQTFVLTLINGEPIRLRVMEPAEGDTFDGEDPRRLSQITLDASGLALTLTILEGIAAEGKEWIKHRHRRADKRLARLLAEVRDLVE